MKEGWKYKNLGDVIDITMGQSPSSDTYNESEGLPFFQGNADFGKMHPNVRVYCNAPIRIADKNDILISVRAPIGAINIADRKCCIGRGLAALRGSNKYENRFLYYFLNASKEKLIAQGTGSTFKSIGKDTLKSLQIPVLTISEQERIVAELDLLSGIIDKQNVQLKELDTLAQSIFYDMFGNPIENEKGWKVKRLGDVALIKIGPFGSLLHTSDYITGGTPLVNPIHMKNGRINPDNNFTISEEKKGEMLPYLLKKGDIVFARRGEIGRCAIVSEKENGYLCGTGSLFVRFTEPINEVYVLYLTKSDSFIRNLVSKAKGATMLNINCKIVEDLEINIPPLSLQQLFATQIVQIEQLKEKINRSIVESKKIFNHTMENYFSC